MAIRIEKADAVTTVIMDRPERRNAVDAEHARGLADAFRAFEADSAARVAVLWGANGTFCAGADLKAFAEGAGDQVRPDGDGPMGPTRMLLSKPVIAAIAGHAVAGRPRARDLVRPAGRRGGRRCSACSAGAGACRCSTAARSASPG